MDKKSSDDAIRDSVKHYYGEVLKSSADLKTNCCTAGTPPPYIAALIAQVPEAIVSRFYGCGSVTPAGVKGLTMLDLGSGSGLDCYVLAALVGPTGQVIGVDMTDGQLELARAHVDSYCLSTLHYTKPNITFFKGYIENLGEAGIAPNSIDIAVSNCVVNLSPDKPAVLKSVFSCLKPGGEFYFSDVFCDRRLPEHLRRDEVLHGECIAGAMYEPDFLRQCHQIGFTDPRIVTRRALAVDTPAMKSLLGPARFWSVTYRLFKLEGLEVVPREDYGQIAIYKGTIEHSEWNYQLDQDFTFETGRPVMVDGNTAQILQKGWLAPHFQVIGDHTRHFGKFLTKGESSPASSGPAASSGAGGCCKPKCK